MGGLPSYTVRYQALVLGQAPPPLLHRDGGEGTACQVLDTQESGTCQYVPALPVELHLLQHWSGTGHMGHGCWGMDARAWMRTWVMGCRPAAQTVCSPASSQSYASVLCTGARGHTSRYISHPCPADLWGVHLVSFCALFIFHPSHYVQSHGVQAVPSHFVVITVDQSECHHL